MKFTREGTEDGVTERLFDLVVAGDTVPGAIWAPEDAKGPRPIVLMGHGGSQHKKVTTLAARARHYAKAFGYAAAAIDAPGHGARVSPEESARFPATAALDAVQGLEFVGSGGPVGHWGVSMGTALGVPFVSIDLRIAAAVRRSKVTGPSFQQAASFRTRSKRPGASA